jgi:hypothetical protein
MQEKLPQRLPFGVETSYACISLSLPVRYGHMYLLISAFLELYIYYLDIIDYNTLSALRTMDHTLGTGHN